MNLILFRENEELGYLASDDYRYKHIITIIKPSINDQLDFGVVNGLKGKLTITKIDENGIYYNYLLNTTSPNLYPITLLIGTPRPPVAKRLLKDLSSTGIKRIIMCATDLGEKTYLTSKLWSDHNYMEYIYDGLSQAETTIIPQVDKFFSLKKAIESLEPNIDKLVLDNNDAELSFNKYKPVNKEVIVCIGGERGFSKRELIMLKENKFSIFSYGSKVLRTETICHNIIGSILTIKNLI